MRQDISSGTAVHADLSLEYSHHTGGYSMTKQDKRVASVEFVGTFFLAFIITASRNNMNPASHPFAIGFGLCCLIYAFGPTSGGQFNPAVTLGLWCRQKISTFEAGYCAAAQVLGAIVATLACYCIYGEKWSNVAAPSIAETSSTAQAFVAEFLQTFLLVLTVLNTATTAVQANNAYFGLAIGSVVVSGALIVGSVSGGCFNPAIAFISILEGYYFDSIIYIVAQLLGSIVAAIIFRIMNPAEWEDSDPSARLTHSHRNPDGNVTRTGAMLCTEAIGTMMLTYTIALSGNAMNGNGFLAVGLILTSLVYMGGSVSGGHFNPAVSIGVYLNSAVGAQGDMRLVDCCLYIISQIIGAFAGGKLASFVNSGHITGPTVDVSSGRTDTDAILAEAIFTYLLMTVVLFVACSSKVSGNSYYGIAIGFAVLAAASSIGDVSGAALNPAVGIALTSLRSNTRDMFIYIIGPIIGSVLAVLSYLNWSGDDDIL